MRSKNRGDSQRSYESQGGAFGHSDTPGLWRFGSGGITAGASAATRSRARNANYQIVGSHIPSRKVASESPGHGGMAIQMNRVPGPICFDTEDDDFQGTPCAGWALEGYKADSYAHRFLKDFSCFGVHGTNMDTRWRYSS